MGHGRPRQILMVIRITLRYGELGWGGHRGVKVAVDVDVAATPSRTVLRLGESYPPHWVCFS